MIEKEPTHTNKVQKIMFLFFMDAERERIEISSSKIK